MIIIIILSQLFIYLYIIGPSHSCRLRYALSTSIKPSTCFLELWTCTWFIPTSWSCLWINELYNTLFIYSSYYIHIISISVITHNLFFHRSWLATTGRWLSSKLKTQNMRTRGHSRVLLISLLLISAHVNGTHHQSEILKQWK